MDAYSGAYYCAKLFRQYGHEPRLMVMQCLHRTRLGFIEEKTAIYNHLRGLISEQKSYLPLQVQQCVDDLLEHVDRIEANIAEYDRLE
jgi:transposase